MINICFCSLIPKYKRQIKNVIIEKVNSIKYLDFTIDKELKFNDHMEFICKKIGKKSDFSNA